MLFMSVAQTVQVTIQLSIIKSVLCENHKSYNDMPPLREYDVRLQQTVPKALLLSEYLERQNSV